MKFSALNVDFSNLSPDPLGLRKPAQRVSKSGFPFKSGNLSAADLYNVKMVADRNRHVA